MRAHNQKEKSCLQVHAALNRSTRIIEMAPGCGGSCYVPSDDVDAGNL